MKRTLKRIGILVGILVALIVLGAAGAFINASRRLNRTYDVQPEAISIPTETTAVTRGQYIFSSRCAGCHGDDAAGTPFFEDPALGSIPAPNLTAGSGGIGGAYTDTDFVRAIRHGLRPDGTPLMIMPSGALYYLDDGDLGALIAYLHSVAPQDSEWGAKQLSPVAHIMLTAGMFGNVLQAETIDHDGPRPATVSHGVTAAYGEYLVNTGDCRGCHGQDLAGAQPGEPGAPAAPDLTPGEHLSRWSTEDFRTAMRTGMTPDGHEIDGAFMPWEEIGRMTDDDLDAMFLYLQSLPPTRAAN